MVYNWAQSHDFKGLPENPQAKLSILVPYRNEESNLNSCLNSLLNQSVHSDQFEIILIDDGSEDKSSSMVNPIADENSHIQVIQSKGEGKKSALKTGIERAKYKWIATLDADTIVDTNWAQTLLSFIEKSKVKFVVMPVELKSEAGLFQKMQELEFLSLTGSGACSLLAGKSLLANGANLAFEKNFFKELGGYEDNMNWASGDDLFLFFKAYKKDAERVKYLKSREVIARANSCINMSEFIDQRLRWASKTSAYTSVFPKRVAWLILSVNLFLLFVLILSFIQPNFWVLMVSLLCIKLVFDFFFIAPILKFHQKEKLIFYSIPLSILYPFYIVLIGLLSFLYKPKWKGRPIVIDEV